MTQFSLFGAAAAEPTLDDLAGILLAGGHWVVRQSGSANLSVVVEGQWRVDALREEFLARGLGFGTDGYYGVPNAVELMAGRRSVQTGFAATLAAEARRWIRGANEVPPRDLVLTPSGLRLWAVASGHRDESGYLLGTAHADDPMHLAAGAQLSRLGVAGVSITRGGPGWRVTSLKRIRRLAELVGAAPSGAEAEWPSPS